MLKFNIINVEENIDQNLSFFLQKNEDTEKALIKGIATLKNTNSNSGTNFDSLTYLAVNYFYDHIYVYLEKDDNDNQIKQFYKRPKSTNISEIKTLFDACNYTKYIPIVSMDSTKDVKLFNANYYTECYLIIQTAYFFGSKRFGQHPYIDIVEHYRRTSEVLQNNLDEERLKKAFKRIDDYWEWEKNPTKFKKKPIQFNKDTYLNKWYYGVLDILANIFETCTNYKYEYPLKKGTREISEYRFYNNFITTPRILRYIQPFEMIEFDIKSGHLSYIDLCLGSNVAKMAYENYANKHNISREKAKRKFQTILNLRDRRNNYKQKKDYIDTLCGFGWTQEQADIIMRKITDSPDYLFGNWATRYEEQFVNEFAKTNDIKGWTRGHDSLNFLKKRDVDYTSFCMTFQNEIIQFELKDVGSIQVNNEILQHNFDIEKSDETLITSPLDTFDDKFNYIINKVEKYTRNKGEVLDGYISEKIEELIKALSFLHINVLISPASSGKTSMVVKLKERGYRCLLIVPTKAIIKNKNLDGFTQVYETTDIQKHINTKESIICTFDKGAQIKPNNFNKFNYIIIDESHLLFTEDYRKGVLVLLLKNINNYILNVRNNLEVNASSNSLIFMTGTPTGEEFYFELDRGKSIIKKKEFINNKKRSATFVCSEDKNSCFTSFINKIKELLNDNHRVFVPTNMGEKWINSVIEIVGIDPSNCAIYSNNQRNSQSNEDINRVSKIDENIKLLFSTSLGNVGIDINNKDMKTAMTSYIDYPNSITWQEIEQYNNRFRETDVPVFAYFTMPKNIDYVENFVFNYEEDPNEIALIENHISTDLFTDWELENMQDEYGVDRNKVRWGVFSKELKKYNSNIITIAGSLKSSGYDVNFIKAPFSDSELTKEFIKLLDKQNELEEEIKLRALDFILSDVYNLIKNINDYTIKTGNNSLIEKTLTIENEQIFRSIRLLVKRCVQINADSNFSWVKRLMEKCKMNFNLVEDLIKYMKFVHDDSVDDLDNSFIKRVDEIVNLKDGKGILTKIQYNEMLEELAPKYINKAYNDMDQKAKEKQLGKLKKKLAVCYIINVRKNVTFKQRFTEVLINETIVWFEDEFSKLETEAPVNERIIRNRKGQAIGKAVGKSVGLNIGKAYENINSDMIVKIKEKLNIDGFITIKSIAEITGLPIKSIGHFIKLNFPELTPTSKMIDRVRETRYSLKKKLH
jgi:hypothetical protein